jgi:hypothetical protein
MYIYNEAKLKSLWYNEIRREFRFMRGLLPKYLQVEYQKLEKTKDQLYLAIIAAL